MLFLPTRRDEDPKEYQRAVELFPKAGRMYLRLAQIQESRGAARQATASFEKAAHYSPGFGGAHCQVAQLALHLGDKKKALAAVRESARLARSVETWDCIAGCLDALGLHDQAQEARRRRTALDPDSPPPARGPNSSRLAAEFSRALIPSVRYRGLRERLIYEFLSQRAFAKAERLAFVEMTASEVPDALQDVAHYYLQAGLPDKAATLCKIGLDLDPYWAAGHACLGWSNLESKEPDYPLASRSLSRAMELLYEGAPAEFAASMLEDILGRFRETGKVIPKSILVGILGTDWSGRGRLSMTAAYYRHLAAYLREAGIPLVTMQYPTLPIQDLQSLLPDKAGIVFIENRDNFLRALAAEPKENIFTDLFRRTWGHCTQKGNRLIAENLAERLDKAGLIPRYRPPGP